MIFKPKWIFNHTNEFGQHSKKTANIGEYHNKKYDISFYIEEKTDIVAGIDLNKYYDDLNDLTIFIILTDRKSFILYPEDDYAINKYKEMYAILSVDEWVIKNIIE